MSDRWPSTPALLWRQIRYQNTMFWRSPVAAFFTLILPLVMLVLFNAIFNGTVDLDSGPVSIAQFYAPALAVFTAASATYTSLAILQSIRRDDGILKRVRGTPLPPWIYLGGAIGSGVTQALVGAVVMLGLGVAAYDVDIELARMPAALVTFAVGVAAFAALGLAVVAVSPDANTAQATVNATLLPIAFVSNVFIPLEDPPRWLEILGDFFPLKHFVEAFQKCFTPGVDAPAFSWGKLVYIAVWGVVGAAVAARFFRWEPATGSGRRTRRGGSSKSRGRRSR
ncbi:MAG: ABC transporter permease [Acidimicrobiales bacterium]|nr:ABC transporter permease [Acidimicrobiales bacterium]